MQDSINSNSQNDIKLSEIFITLWAFKIFIAFSCALGIAFGGYYALYTDKKFTSEAIFKLEEKNNNFALNRGLESLVSVSRFGGQSASKTIIFDQIMGRIFIEAIDKKLNFQSDTYFNTHNPNSIDPTWKLYIKRAISWQNSPINTQEAMWQNIVTNFSKNVTIDESPNGPIKIVVTHVIPQRAAAIANVIMDQIISNAKSKRDEGQDQVLSYLSNTLAKALSDLEISQSNLKEFSIKNSSLPLEVFAAGSLELDALREQLTRTSELHKAVAALTIMLQNKTTDNSNYLALRKSFPIVDQVEFRRILGQNEIISSWSWPDVSSVDAIFDTLTERKNRLQSQINASQVDAERSSLALETYAKLEREANIAEATYTVLVEQVKAQSMAVGYRPDRTEVYEYASVPVSHSSPNRKLNLTLGAAIGLLIGTMISLLIAQLRGVCYSKKSICEIAQAQLTDSVKTMIPFRKKSLKDVNTILIKKPRPALRNIAVEIHKSDLTQVLVTSLRAKLKANDVGRALASYMQSDNMKVAVIDFSSKEKMLDLNKKKGSFGAFIVTESAGNVSVLIPDNNLSAMELLGQKEFTKNIQTLNSTIDLLFLCADDSDAISLLRAMQLQKTFHITLARTKYTHSATLKQISSLLKIQGLLHD